MPKSARRRLSLPLVLLLIGAALPVQADPAWHCRNEFEIRCRAGACSLVPEGEFTPLSVAFDSTGSISVCAYTGCWDGRGRAEGDDRFLTVSARGLPFSTASEEDPRRADVALLFDRETAVALLHADGFALPLNCVAA